MIFNNEEALDAGGVTKVSCLNVFFLNCEPVFHSMGHLHFVKILLELFNHTLAKGHKWEKACW